MWYAYKAANCRGGWGGGEQTKKEWGGGVEGEENKDQPIDQFEACYSPAASIYPSHTTVQLTSPHTQAKTV